MISILISLIPPILIRWVFVRNSLSKWKAAFISLPYGLTVNLVLKEIFERENSTLGGSIVVLSFLILIWKKDDQASNDKKLESPKKTDGSAS